MQRKTGTEKNYQKNINRFLYLAVTNTDYSSTRINSSIVTLLSLHATRLLAMDTNSMKSQLN